MIRSRVLGALLCALLLLAPTACDDPTSVGGELIDEPNVGPERAELDLAVTDTTYAPVTGTASITSASRFLAGRTTNDPLGNVGATGYIDFARTSAPENLAGRTIDTVEVQLTPASFYGDTTQASEYGLYDMEDEWEAAGASADTSLAETVEPQRIKSFEVQPSDTLVTVMLPDAWVQDHTRELTRATDSTFADAFHGFQIRPTGGGSVASFNSTEVSMRAVFEQDGGDDEPPEAQYRLTRHLTTIRQDNPQSPEDRYVIQGGTGRSLKFTFDFSDLPEAPEDIAVNSASLVFEVDSTLASTPVGFTRPWLDTLDLYNATDTLETEPRLFQGASFVLTDGESPRFENDFPLIDLVQDLLLGTSDLDRFQLRPPLQTVRIGSQQVRVPVPSLNSTLIRSDADHQPRLVLTYTSTDE